jgi:hypothetical protein
MTVITHPRRKSRLSKLMDTAGGVSAGTVLAEARNQLETLRPRSIAEVAHCIEGLEQLEPPASPDETTDRLAAAYRLASGVIDSAGPFDLEDVCTAAAGLCDLLDAATPARAFDWRVLPVFARSMRLLMALPPQAKDERARILSGLAAVIERKLVQP